MLEKDMKEMRYVSCIKINGVPILPPLVTHSKRKEMHKYKQQAMKFEKHLKREHELRQYINRYYTPNLDSSTNLLVTNTLEHKLSFEDSISPINDTKNYSSTSTLRNEVSSGIQKKASQLSCNLQASQYTNNEFTVLTNFGKYESDVVIIDDVCQGTENNFSEEHNLETKADISDMDNQKPRLIRSNSYIIETPSPMLLEHLRKQSLSLDTNTEDSAPLLFDSNVDGKYIKETRNIDTFLLEGNEVGYICQNDESSLNNSSNSHNSRSESELKNISYFSDQISNNGDVNVIDSRYHLKEFIDNNVPKMLDNDIFSNENAKESENCINGNIDKSDILNVMDCVPQNSIHLKEQFMCYDDDSLNRVLNNVPEIYSRQIVELLEKHKQEQLLKFTMYMNKNQSSIDDNSILDNKQLIMKDRSSQISQNLESIPKLDQNLRNKFMDTPSSYHILSSDDTLRYDKISDLPKLTDRTLHCSRELFPNYDTKRRQQSKEDHAASIIGATAKGYLIRRLMRTDRVQGLIQTIRDALICAMQLHTENNDSINESDVELHRRLIQQVSAACFEFYDVFFSLNTAEQMTIIRLDRERLKEKLKRPLSGSTNRNKTSRSASSITVSN